MEKNGKGKGNVFEQSKNFGNNLILIPSDGINETNKVFVKNENKDIGNKKRITKKDGSKNAQNVNENSSMLLEIICRKHGQFSQCPADHLQGHGCPKCINIISNQEKDFLDYLHIPNTKENRQVLIKRKKVDGLNNNTIYEFLGDYWHGNPEKFDANEFNKSCKKTYGELYYETIQRFRKLKTIGYGIKYIWETDWKAWNKNKSLEFPIKTFLGIL